MPGLFKVLYNGMKLLREVALDADSESIIVSVALAGESFSVGFSNNSLATGGWVVELTSGVGSATGAGGAAAASGVGSSAAWVVLGTTTGSTGTAVVDASGAGSSTKSTHVKNLKSHIS